MLEAVLRLAPVCLLDMEVSGEVCIEVEKAPPGVLSLAGDGGDMSLVLDGSGPHVAVAGGMTLRLSLPDEELMLVLGAVFSAPFDLQSLPVATNAVPDMVLVRQSGIWGRAAFLQFVEWLGGLAPSPLPIGIVTVNGSPVTVGGDYVVT